MCYAIVWEFLVPEAQRADFESAYGPCGPWAKLFERAPGFLGVQLLCSPESAGRYLTIDRWQSAIALENFKSNFAQEYHALDRQLEGLASSEVCLGAFDEIPKTGDDQG